MIVNKKPAQTARGPAPFVIDEALEEEVAYLAKRHRVSAAVVREIMRSIASGERSAVEREIKRGQARR